MTDLKIEKQKISRTDSKTEEVIQEGEPTLSTENLPEVDEFQ
jgi:hypothetical protein